MIKLVIPLSLCIFCFGIAANGEILKVGTKPVPPFAFKPGPGDLPAPQLSAPWGGWSWDYWNEAIFPVLQNSAALNITGFVVVGYADNSELLDALANREVDVGVAAVTLTANREKVVDFSVPFYISTLQILVRDNISESASFLDTLSAFGSLLAIFAVGTCCLVLSTAMMLYVAEEASPSVNAVFRLDGPLYLGLLDAVKLSSVLVLTGRGTRFPSGRFSAPLASLCATWAMLLPVILTAVTTVSLSQVSIRRPIESFADLSEKEVLVARASTSQTYLEQNGVGIKILLYGSIDEAFAAFFEGTGDAVVYNTEILQFAAYQRIKSHPSERYAVVGEPFAPEKLGIALPDGTNDTIREIIDQSILETWQGGFFRRITAQWLEYDVSSASSESASPNAQQAEALAVVAGCMLFLGIVAILILTLRRRYCPQTRERKPRHSTKTATRTEIKRIYDILDESRASHDSDILASVLQLLADTRLHQLQSTIGVELRPRAQDEESEEDTGPQLRRKQPTPLEVLNPMH